MEKKQKELLINLQKQSELTQFKFMDLFRRLYNEFCPDCRNKIFVKINRKTRQGKTISYEGVVNTLCKDCLANAIEKTKEAGELL